MDSQNSLGRNLGRSTFRFDQEKLIQEELDFFDENYDSQGSIGQYLNFSEDSESSGKEKQISKKSKPTNPQKSLIKDPEEKSKLTTKQRSIFHNFQKHLTTTIRRTIPPREIAKSGQLGEIAIKIWEVLLHEKYSSKDFLYVLFGVVKQEGEFSPEALAKYKILPVYEKYGQHAFKASQRYLREKVVQIFNDMDDQKILYQRRVQKKSQFIQYIRQFIGELEDGVCLSKKAYKNKKAENQNIVEGSQKSSSVQKE